MSNYVIGVDVGGTNVKLGLISSTGKISARSSFSTKNFSQKPKTLIVAVHDAVMQLLLLQGLSKRDIAGIGIGLPGLVDSDRGVVRILPNIPGWRDVPLKKIMEKELGILVRLENDVNMITLGEWRYGAGKGFQDLICIALGTGVGGGLILNNAIYRGPGYAAGEIGHMPLSVDGPECGCGGWGCYERSVGNKALKKDAAKMFGKEVALEELYLMARQGKKKALKFWDMVGERVGNGLVGPINFLNPECVIIGGGVSRSLEFMRPAIEKVIKHRCMKTQAEMVRIIKARLDDDAGIVGAQVLVRYEKKH
jgi:glucokinase